MARLQAAGCVFAEDEAALLIASGRKGAALDALIEQRVAGRPLEHLLGWAEFAELRVEVDPGVFVPRRRTRLLAEQAIERARDRPHPLVVELCCGSGAISASITAARPDADVVAADIDPIAVSCARRNLPMARVLLGDLYDPLPATLRGQVDVLVANAPYVPTAAIATMPPEARLHEDRVALDGGADGLDVLRRLIAPARTWLAPGGHLLFETSPVQAEAIGDAVRRQGLHPRIVRDEDLDATIVLASAADPASLML